MADTPDPIDQTDAAPAPPAEAEIYPISVDVRKVVFRPDHTDRGDTPIDLRTIPRGGEGYLQALHERVDSIIGRHGGPEAFDKWFLDNLDGVPADACVARLVKDRLGDLESAIRANDVFGAIRATVEIERDLAAPWTDFARSTGYKSGRSRKQNSDPRNRELLEAIKRRVEELRKENPHLSSDAAITSAAKKFGRSRSWFYRQKKSFGNR